MKRRAWLANVVSAGCLASARALGAEQWQEANFPAPNAGRLAFTITADGNPACATYDGANCLWGKSVAEIDFAKVKPLACGARHRELYGSTGFEDPKHWCNLALRLSGATPPPAPAQPTPAPPPATTTRPPPPPAPTPSAGPRLSDWSPWARAADVDYRYRVRWDPATGGPGKTIEAIFEIRNRGSKTWAGVARSLDCAQGTLWGSSDVSVGAQQTREARVRAPNCGTARNPDIRPNVVRQGKFD
jgi:hypothetical protein